MNETVLEQMQAREEMEYLLKKRRRRKKILAFLLAVTILITFAIPISMMIPPKQPDTNDTDNTPPVYSMYHE